MPDHEFEINGKRYSLKLDMMLQEICDLECECGTCPPDIGKKLCQAATDYLRGEDVE